MDILTLLNLHQPGCSKSSLWISCALISFIMYVKWEEGGEECCQDNTAHKAVTCMHMNPVKVKKKKNFGRGQGALNIEECPCQEVFGVDKFGIKQVCQQRNGWSLTASARVTYSCSGHFVHHEGTGCRYKAWALLEHSSWFKFVICETWHCWVLDHVTFSVLQRSLSTCSWAWSPSSSGEELVYTRLQWSMLPVQYGGCGHFWLFYMS